MGLGLGAASQQGGGFTPPDIAGNVLWLRADNGYTLDGSGNVSQWNDFSGSGNNVSQGTAGKRPAYQATGGPNGTPALAFVAGSSQSLDGSTSVVASKTNLTIFIVEQQTSTGGNNNFYSLGNSIGLASQGGGSPKWDLAAIGVLDQTDSSAASNTSWNVLTCAVGAGPVWQLRVNGVNHVLSSNTATPNNLAAAQHVGWNSGSGFLTGSIAEVIVYNGVLTLAQMQQVEAYLGGRYGISVGA